MVSYIDANFGGCPDDLKSISRHIFVIANIISWKSVKQTLVASSTMQTEFVARYCTTIHAAWFRNFIFGLMVVDSISKPFTIYCENFNYCSILLKE